MSASPAATCKQPSDLKALAGQTAHIRLENGVLWLGHWMSSAPIKGAKHMVGGPRPPAALHVFHEAALTVTGAPRDGPSRTHQEVTVG